MRLQGRTLQSEMKGSDVALLQRELRLLDFVISDEDSVKRVFGPATRAAVREFQAQRAIEPTGVVDERTAAAIGAEVSRRHPRVVRGTVANADGTSAAGLAVNAFDRDLRHEEPLGQATTNAAGHYEITYTTAQFRRAEKETADLVVRIVERDGEVLISSDVIFNAHPVEIVDFIVEEDGARVSEFERYVANLLPLLEKIQIAELNERDITFLEGETGIEGIHLAYLTIAHRLAGQTKIAAEAFYGWFRQDLPTSLPALTLQSVTQLRRALEIAIEENIIPSSLRDELPRILSTVRSQAIQTVLREAEGKSSAFPQLLRAAGLTDSEQEAFLDSYLQHEGDTEDFWRSLGATSLSNKVQTLQATFQLGLITNNNTRLVSALQAKGIASMRDLPRLGREGLRELILGSDDILAAIDAEEGETNEQKAERFAEGMLEVLRVTAPSAFVQAAYEKSGDGVRRDVARVLSNAPELELRDVDIDRFLSENPRAFADVGEPEPVRRQLKKVQRVLRIAPDAEHAEILMSEGLDSAQAIASMSPDAFAERFADRFGGEGQARSYHSKAGRVNAAVTGIVATVTQGMRDLRPGVIGAVPGSVKELPNFTTLFGSQSFCSCEHCGSVLSPAAYLVDLLQFINPRGGQKPITELRKRRPDIEHIPLTCENANTPLPYIDLVNEILEFYVAHGAITKDAPHNTKGMSAAELSINPQHIVDEAYTTLAARVYPPQLPFHRPLAVMRAYLEQMGSSRHELMDAFRRGAQPTPDDIATELLQLSEFERDILTGTTGKPLATFYGFPAGQNPSGRDEIKVAEFLDRTGTTYEELVELVGTQFLNPQGNIELEDDQNPPACDPEKITLKNLNGEFWRGAYRFIRLWRRLGWPVRDLDRACEVFKTPRVSVKLLRKLATLEKLREKLTLPTPVLLSFWGDLDTSGPSSSYARLFLNKAVLNPPAPAFKVGSLDDSDALLVDNSATILAALRINSADFDALAQHLALAPDEKLSLSLLSQLHRHVALARALRLRITEFLSLLTLSGEDPFRPRDPSSTIRFVDLARLVRESGFTISQLSYLYLSETPNASALTDASVRSLFKGLRDGLRKIAATAPELSAPTGDALKAALALVVHESLVGNAEELVDKPAPLDAVDLEFIDKRFTFLSEADRLALATDLTPEARRKRVVGGISLYLRRDFVRQTLAESLRIEVEIVSALVERILVSRDDAAQMAIQDFLKPAGVPDDALDAAFDSFARSYLLLHKAAILSKEFGFRERELIHFHMNPTDFEGFDLNSLPLERSSFTTQHFSQWRRMARYVDLARGVPQRDATLIDVFEAAQLPAQENPRETALELLKVTTGWNPAEVDFAAGPGGLNLTSADDFRSEERLVPLKRCLRLSDHLGVSCSQLFNWVAAEPDAGVADEVVNAAKAKYTDERWPIVAKPINDVLRESRKRALIAYTLDRTNLTDSNNLFERFLIDVEMSACMNTSRIKQAISSVQLFIQRCLMNLEIAVSPSAIDAEQWEWMKNYRVWEANRKVFLYPENWIEPELRDDKSPIFRDLESELMQGDLDGIAAEQAFLHYLERLDVVGRLEPCGLYVQEASESSEEVVHVFGRTVEEPRTHYYRRFINGRTWTPWEPVNLDIQSDHLLPVVHDRRLYLFWLHFEQKQNESQEFENGFISSDEHLAWLTKHATWRLLHNEWKRVQDIWKGIETWYRSIKTSGLPPVFVDGQQVMWLATLREKFMEGNSGKNRILDDDEPKEPTEPAFSSQPPIVHWQINLNWAEYHRGQWTPKRTSSESIISPMVAMTFREFADKYVMVGDDRDAFRNDVATSEDTIAAVHLPEERTHFVRTWPGDGQLTFSIFRRYHFGFALLGRPLLFEGYESLGDFTLSCGSKVGARSVAGETSFALSRIAYQHLPRPEHTRNAALSFTRRTGDRKLSFRADDQTRHILNNPSGRDFRILYEHAKPDFSLRPPYHDFFYEDQEKTYYARYQSAFPDGLLHRSTVAPGGSFPRHDALLNSFSTRMLPPSSNGQRRSGTRTVIVQNGDTGAVALTSQPKVSEDSAPDRAMSRLGLFPKRKQARITWGLSGSGMSIDEAIQPGLRFYTFFHPHICEFTERLYHSGVPGLLSRGTQQLNKDWLGQSIGLPPSNVFKSRYAPTAEVATPYPHERVDFGGGAYALYNWELFFHIPMLVAVSLTKNQRFADAVSWFHFVFNPTTSSTVDSPRRYWNTLPFFNNTDPEKDQIRELLLTLNSRGPGWEEIEHQISEWLDNPFNPHLIARLRLTAYQKNVVMKYVDTLIAWGDQLFSRDTLESINEATLLYVLAYNILGPRPKTIPREQPAAKSYSALEGELDAFGNAMVEVENAVPSFKLMPEASWASSSRIATFRDKKNLISRQQHNVQGIGSGAAAGLSFEDASERPSMVGSMAGSAGPTYTLAPEYTYRPRPSVNPSISAVRSLYFCVPQNEQLLKYWDLVDDRLLKIRHCMNIEGAVRELPLFEPPIDPALLVRAVAAGLDIGSVLNDLYAPLPRYRFSFTIQKAHELCGELKSLGAALLSAIERKDAEALSNLRARHETSLLKDVRELRRQQIEESRLQLDALQQARKVAEERRQFYSSRPFMIDAENEQIGFIVASTVSGGLAAAAELAAAAAMPVPDQMVGASGWTPLAVTHLGGGSKTGGAFKAVAAGFGAAASIADAVGTVNGIMAGYRRRADDWDLQARLASKELGQIDKQMLAAEIRIAMAEKELDNHDRQIENSVAVEEFLRGKYTNEELYGWMTTQVSRVFFQTYKLASDIAKRAERAFRFELGLKDSNFIQLGYWDSLRKGLLAGEQLSLDLKRLDDAYVVQNKREYEVTRHVSLMLNYPLALMELKETGTCIVNLSEALFDADYPGHYMRRIKSVSLTIPAVVGPYTSINCQLKLSKNSVRVANTLADPNQPVEDIVDDDRFVLNLAAEQSIATSHAQNDSGVFELNFRDERYLPFEGAGAISEWQIELPKATNAFDFNTISDVVLHLKYTARDGGVDLRTERQNARRTMISEATSSPLARLFSLKTEFPTDWYRFLHPTEPAAGQEYLHRIQLDLTMERFPFLFRGEQLQLGDIKLFLKLREGFAYDDQLMSLRVGQNQIELEKDGSLVAGIPSAPLGIDGAPVPLSIAMEVVGSGLPAAAGDETSWWEVVQINGEDRVRLNARAIDDLWLLCPYSVGS